MAKQEKEMGIGINKGKGTWEGIIEKKFGKGTIQYIDSSVIVPCDVIPTGAITLDMALGVGGIPKGRMIEVFGPESSGKTTLALTIVANAQAQGDVAAYVDAEHALDPDWAKRLGVRLEDLAISQPDSGEQALEIVEMMVTSKKVDLVVVDSVAALVPQAEIDGDMGDANVGLQARLISQACRKLAGVMSKNKCTVIFINQLREKIGVMGFGPKETTPGGRALKFWSSVRLDIRRIGSIKDGDVAVANDVRVKVVKNKVAPPFREAKINIYFGGTFKDGTPAPSGIDTAGALIEAAMAAGIAERTGSSYAYGNVRLGNGWIASCGFVRENEDVAKEIRERVLAVKRPAPVAVNTSEEPEADEVDDQT